MEPRLSDPAAYCKNANSPDSLIRSFTDHLNQQFTELHFVCLSHQFAPQAFRLISKTDYSEDMFAKFIKDSKSKSLSVLQEVWLIKPVIGQSNRPDYLFIAHNPGTSVNENLVREFLQFQNIYSGLINMIDVSDKKARDFGAGLISQLTHDINSMIAYLQDIHLSSMLEKKIAYLDILVPKLLLFIREPELSRSKLDLNALVTGIIELNMPERINVKPFPESINLSCDVELINMALTAIISNAYQAAPNTKSKIDVIIDLINSNSPWYDVKWAKISISDTFTGIPADFLPRVFKPLFTTRKNEGHPGLGLSLAQKIVIAHGGSIELHNNSVGGLTVDCYLPLEN